MAITNQAYNELERNSKGLLDVSASDFYFDKVRPHMQEMLLKCKTDKELIRTIEKVINAADSFCVQNNYGMVAESFDVLEVAIKDKSYFAGVMSKAPEVEKEMVRAKPRETISGPDSTYLACISTVATTTIKPSCDKCFLSRSTMLPTSPTPEPSTSTLPEGTVPVNLAPSALNSSTLPISEIKIRSAGIPMLLASSALAARCLYSP